MTFQQSAKRLYVQREYQIEAFSHPSPGTFVPVAEHFPVAVSTGPYFSDLTVDNTSGPGAGHVFWTGEYNEILGLKQNGESLPGFPIIPPKQTCGLAIDSEGDIFAGSFQNESVYEYGPGGGPLLRTIYTPEVGRPCKVAIDPTNDDLYVSSYYEAKIAKITAASNYTSETITENLQSSGLWLAVDTARGVIFTAAPNSPEIRVLSTTTGKLVESFMASGGVRGLAIEEATDTLFVGYEHYDPETETNQARIQEMREIHVPVATTEEPDANTTAAGNADPDGAGPITECFFEYGPEAPAYGQKKNCDQATPISSPTHVTATLPLPGEKTYHYRLVLANAEGKSIGEDVTVVAHNIIDFKTTAASNVTRTTAQLNGEFEGTNEKTTYFFEYGESESYGTRIPESPAEGNAGTTSGPTPISETASGLNPDTTYHFRAFGKNPKGPNEGGDLTFHTAPAVAGMKVEMPTSVTRTTAVLNGSFTGNGEKTELFFEWGQGASYGHTTSPQTTEGSGTVNVSAPIEGLEVDSSSSPPYHFRLVATNKVGTTTSSDRVFTTEGPDAPTVSDEHASGVTSTAATIGATINPGESETVYMVEYGGSQAYGQTTPIESLGSDGSDHAVSEFLSGLTPGTAYHYRVVAINFGGTALGGDQTFVTPAPPAVASTSVSGVTRNSALLKTTSSAGGLPTTVRFEYGTSASYGSLTAAQNIGSSLGFTEVEAQLSGLSAGTTYHYRAVASNGIGDAESPDLTFTTAPAPEEAPPPLVCKKGFVKKHGKCVKKPKKHKRKHHRHG